MFHLTIEVPTRQGVTLRGLHYAPDATPAPVIVSITPYGADKAHPRGKLFASRGFHYVSLDSRGRGDSDGRFFPFQHEAADGHDAVEWLAEQPWSGGDVVLYGGSYCGFNQWAIATTGPTGLRAIAPSASVYPGVDFPIEQNVSMPHVVRWLSLVDGRRANDGPFEDEELWADTARAAIGENRPFRDLDLATIGRRLPVFQEWLDHPERDAYWDGLTPTTAQYRDITVPVLTVTGQYDDDQHGALRYHDEHIAAVKPEVAARHHVVIGPWDHRGTRTAARTFGGLTFAESSEIDTIVLHADWYDWVLGRAGKPEFLTDRVVYFHSGEDRWRSRPDIPAGPQLLWLHPAAGGVLTPAEPQAAHTVELVADPRNATDESRAEPKEDTYFVDDTALRGNHTLVHTTAPLPEPVDLSGRFHARLTLATDLKDFDLLVGVYRLPKDGSTVLLGESRFRARYRGSLRAPTAWPAGVPVSVDIAGFPFVSLRTEPGDRIALTIRPPHRGYQPNFQTGGTISEETLADAVPGVIRLIQDPAQPSYLTLPLA